MHAFRFVGALALLVAATLYVWSARRGTARTPEDIETRNSATIIGAVVALGAVGIIIGQIVR